MTKRRPTGGLETVAIALWALSALMVWSLSETLPKAEDLTITEGTVVAAKWIGGRPRRFVIRVDSTPGLAFQHDHHMELPKRVQELVVPGVSIRIAHTDEATSFLSDNLRVYELSVNGQSLYSLEDQARFLRADRPWRILILTVSALFASFCTFMWWRRRINRSTP